MVHGNYPCAPTKKCDGDNIGVSQAPLAQPTMAIGDAPTLRYGFGFSPTTRTAPHPSSVGVLFLPPSLRQPLKRWLAAANEIFICWATV